MSRRLFAVVLVALSLAACDAGTPSASPGGSSPLPGGSSAAVSSAPPASPSSSPPTATRSATPPPATPTRSAGTRIEGVTLVRSGGIAGLSDTIEVRQDGRWWRGDKRGSTKRSGRLSAAQASRLQELVTDPRLAAEADRAKPGTTNCRDAFSYLLTARHKLIRYTQCPGEGKPPEVTMQIAAFLLDATA